MTGFVKTDSGKPRIGLVPPESILAQARVMTAALAKYPPGNWQIGTDWSRYYDAAQRHMLAWQSGEDLDPETGESHLAHAACCISILIAHQSRGLGTDDR